MTKKYKIDFNNGKVFEVQSSDGTKFFLNSVALHSAELISMGATITEIEEPRREFLICWDYEGHRVAFNYSKEAEVSPYENKVKAVVLNEGEVIVSREKLAEAWRVVGKWADNKKRFDELCKELGLGEG